MFTGIVEEVGQIKSITDTSVVIECAKVLDEVKHGDSVAVNGVCLTVSNYDLTSFQADVSKETMRVTKLGSLSVKTFVNLERAMLVNSRFGGHIVSGHVDCVGKVLHLKKQNEFFDVKISFPREYSKYVVKKGSVTVDGVSLTVYDLTDNSFSVAVIPHTYEHTNIKYLKNNDNVNLEFDILAKYVEKNLLMNDNKSNITEEFLKDNGFV